MSVQSEKSAEEFRKWKEEIEKKCADHILKRPEFKPKRPLEPKANQKVWVSESDNMKGVWFVRTDEGVRVAFYGPTAHLRATKYADAFLNGKPMDFGFEEKGEGNGGVSACPDPCIHCGGRYSHRFGCPDWGV